jgi:hypothetical protein
MGGSSTPSVTSSNTTSNPWSGVQQPILDALGQASQLYGTEYQPYLGSTIAGLSDSTIAAQNGTYSRATLGAPDLNAARGYATDLSTGQFMNANPTANNNFLQYQASGGGIGANPYVQQNSDWTKQVMADNAANQASGFATGTAALNDSLAARAGAFGGSAHIAKQTQDAAALANSIGQTGNQYNMQRSALGAQDYQQSIGNAFTAAGQQQGAYGADVASRLSGAQLAGTLSQDDYNSLNMLRQQGIDQQTQEQKYLDKAQADFNDAQNFPQRNLTNYFNMLTQAGGFGGSGTTQTYGSGGQSWAGPLAGLGLLGTAAYLGKGG